MLKVKNSGSVAAKISLDIDIDGGLSGALWYSLQTLTSQYGAEGATMLEMLRHDDKIDRPGINTEGLASMSEIGSVSEQSAKTVYPSGSGEDCYVFYLLEYGMYTDTDESYAGEEITMDISIDAAQAPDEADGFGNPKYDKDAVLPTVREQ